MTDIDGNTPPSQPPMPNNGAGALYDKHVSGMPNTAPSFSPPQNINTPILPSIANSTNKLPPMPMNTSMYDNVVAGGWGAMNNPISDKAVPNIPQQPITPVPENLGSQTTFKQDPRSMSDKQLMQNATRDAKAQNVAHMMPEQRGQWAYDNEYAVERLRRKAIEDEQKQNQGRLHHLGLAVRQGQISPMEAESMAAKLGMDYSADGFARYLPTMRTSHTSRNIMTLPEYQAMRQNEANIAKTNTLPTFEDMKVINQIGQYGKTQADTAKSLSQIKTPEQLALESKKTQSEIDKNTSQIKTPEERQLQIEKTQSEIAKNLRGKTLNPSDIKTGKITDLVNSIESKPEAQRTFEEKATLDKYYRGTSSDAEMQQANKFREEFNAQVPFKNYQQAQTITNYMNNAMALNKSGNRIASDQMLINGLNKLLDPQSVVRESEYARTPEGAATLNKLQGYTERIASGGVAISDADRQAIMDAANQVMNGVGSQYNSVFDRYEQIAKTYGVNPEMIFGSLTKFQPIGQQSALPQMQSTQMSPQDQEAIAWANANPNDPRASEILKRNGVQ